VTSSGSTLSPGADAGIGVGVALVLIAIAGLAFWAYQRGKKKGAAARAAEAQAALGNQMSSGIQHQQYDPMKYSDVPQYQQAYQQHELPTHRQYNTAAELGGTGQHELP
jgi:Tfp pilus assembly protein PilV